MSPIIQVDFISFLFPDNNAERDIILIYLINYIEIYKYTINYIKIYDFIPFLYQNIWFYSHSISKYMILFPFSFQIITEKEIAFCYI